MQHTTNYNLSQYEATDRVTRESFNADNAAIDAALKSIANISSGRPRLETWSYTGTGGYGSQNVMCYQFAAKPVLIVVIGEDSFYIGKSGMLLAVTRNSEQVAYIRKLPLTWHGTEVEFYSGSAAANQANSEGVSYTVIGLCA